MVMWKEEEIKAYLKGKVKPKRYEHILGVCDSAMNLSKLYGGDVEKAKLAALIHDCAKYMESNQIIALVESEGYNLDNVTSKCPDLLHGLAGAIIGRREMGIEDEEVFSAVRYHTTGKANMTLLEKIIYVADYIEPGRDFPGVELLRKVTYNNLDKGVLMAFDNTIKHVLSKGQLLHLDTIVGRNYLISKD